MALYQPTSIIPSSYTKGTVDVNDNMEISWQVNGNSAMTAFQIDFYLNDYASTFVTTTGKQPVDNFYGTDRFGRPDFFTWSAEKTWAQWSFANRIPFTNGNEYKYKITQWYEGENEVIGVISGNVTAGTTYYFTVPSGNTSAGAIVYFTATETLQNKTFYYSLTTGYGWYKNGDEYRLLGMNLNTSGNSGEMTLLGSATNITGEQPFISQTISNIIKTQATPQIVIYQTDINYSVKTPFQNYVKIITSEELAVNSTNYFSFDTKSASGEVTTNYASFTVSGNTIPTNTSIFFNISENTAYYLNESNEQVPLSITVSTSQPTSGSGLGKATLFIETSIGFFKANYIQNESIAIKWIRWQVATANNGTIGEILADTGDVYTPTLNYEFNGFFNGQQYAIRALGESESGQECNSGWIYFTINIKNQSEYSGDFTVQYLNKENATLLQWDGVEVIPPTTSPDGYNPIPENGSVTLLPQDGETQYSISWNKVSDKQGGLANMNFSSPWTVAWKGKLSFGFSYISDLTELGNEMYTSTFSPDGKLLVLSGLGYGNIAVYSVSGTKISYVSQITKNGITLNYLIKTIAFSPDGNTLVVGGTYKQEGYVSVFSVNGTEITYVSDLAQGGTTVINRDVFTVAFSPDGKLLVVGGDFYSYTYAYVFSVNGTNITYTSQLVDGYQYDFHNITNKITFSPDGKLLIVVGHFNTNSSYSTYDIYRFSVDDSIITRLENFPTSLNGAITAVTFSPNGETLIVGGSFYRYAYIYSVNGTEISYNSEITKKGVPLNDTVNTAIFSPDGKTLILGGFFNGYISNFTVDGTEITYDSDLTQGGATYSEYVHTAAFSPDGKTLIVNRTIFSSPNPPIGSILELELYSELEQKSKNLTLTCANPYVNLILDNTIIGRVAVLRDYISTAILIQPTSIVAYYYSLENRVTGNAWDISSNISLPITSLAIYGVNIGITVNSVSVYQGILHKKLLNELYNDPNFEPVWNSADYKLYMSANFIKDLEGGTASSNGKGFRVYRQAIDKTALTPIAMLPATMTSLKDYGIRSQRAYKYALYVYDEQGAFMTHVENEKIVATCFNNYSLLVCDYDEANDEYHVRKQYLFALNLNTGSVGNNNSPTLNANFTRYPTRMPSTQNYASGTLSGLIGAIYTVPALIEQIGNYKYTAKPSTMDYFDNVDLEKELYDLSTAPYQLFLRDMKGRLRMIHTSAPITMTTNIKQKQQSISMSLPWVEIGDASDITIIQTPDDYGWNNDNQILDVQLDVDVATGELSATYPFPYNGTKFYLTGVNKETLTAKTPLGITPAQFDLSDTVTEPDDGELNATVKVNSEDN